MDWKELEPTILGYLSAVLKREIKPEELTLFTVETMNGHPQKVVADIDPDKGMTAVEFEEQNQ